MSESIKPSKVQPTKKTNSNHPTNYSATQHNKPNHDQYQNRQLFFKGKILHSIQIEWDHYDTRNGTVFICYDRNEIEMFVGKRNDCKKIALKLQRLLGLPIEIRE